MKIGNSYAPAASWPALQAQFGEFIPRLAEIVPARVPSPPLLTAEMSKRKALRVMALGFRAAMAHSWGSAGRMLSEVESDDRDAILQSKYLQPMLDAIPLMIDFKVAPASWTLFSIMVWRQYVLSGPRAWDAVPSRSRKPNRGVPPTPSFVFSKKRLETRTEWFAFHEAHCRGGKLLISDAHRALVARYDDLKQVLLGLQEPTEATVREAVQQMLTQRTCDRLAKAVQQGYDFQQDELNARVQGGEWLW